MGKALSILQRHQIVGLRKAGQTYQTISEQLDLSFSSVRTICQRYQKEGEKGLETNYNNCGKSAVDSSNLIYRAALWLKHLHPLWGTPRIHTKLKERYSNQVPTIRTIDRWYVAAGLHKPRNRNQRESIGQSTAVHNIWQVDAKENLTLTDGQKACYLTITDEKSGAWLASFVFSLWTYLSSTS
jgi:hypothetical protein